MPKSPKSGSGGSTKRSGGAPLKKRGGYSGSGSGKPKIPQNLSGGAGTPKKKTGT
jgi:hypothetical protein